MKDDLVEQIARAMNPILFGGLPDGECGPATAAARQEARNKAHAAYEVARPAILEEAAQAARECFDDPQAEADADYIPSAIRALSHTTGQAASSTDTTAPAQAAGQLELTPLHLELLRRGSVGRYISLTGDMTFRHAEMDALSELRAAGYAEHSKDPLPPGPPRPTSSVITDAGRAALAHTTGQEPAPTCPICAEPFKADDICAADINEGTCHAECLEGSPVVYLDTGEPSDGPVDTFTYGQEGGR